MAKSNLKKYKDDVVKAYVSQAKRDFNAQIQRVNNELAAEVRLMYDSLITDFYKYKTRSYVRHFQYKPGTGEGDNLFYANRIRVRNGAKPALIVDIDATEMAGGYQNDSKEIVLDDVLSGIRFAGHGNDMHWTSDYAGPYFSYAGTPNEIFDQLLYDFDNIAATLLYPYWKSLGYIV